METLRDKGSEALCFVLPVDGVIIDLVEELGQRPSSIVNSKDEIYNETLTSWYPLSTSDLLATKCRQS